MDECIIISSNALFLFHNRSPTLFTSAQFDISQAIFQAISFYAYCTSVAF